jgi:hypothetical protein
MRNRWYLPAVLLLSLAPASAGGATSVGINVNIGAPPPPVLVYRSEPRLVLVPGSMVYMVDDDACAYDFFHVGVYWYISNNGYWYRARSYRGPFAAIAVSTVPPGIFRVPEKRWKHPHGGPPGLMRRDRGREVVVVKERGGHGRGHGHGRD